MGFNRRDFLNVSVLSSLALLPDITHSEDHHIPVDSSEAFGVLVDTVVCVGCLKCEWACNQQHSLTNKQLKDFEDKSVFSTHRRPSSKAYTVVNQVESDKDPNKFTMKVQCMHCLEPACVSGCIVGALEKSSNGPVVYDAWKCIGCRYCVVACPFQVPTYEYENAFTPQVRKCTFCVERNLENGELPACVEICPNEALTFGPRQTLIDIAKSRIKMYPDKYVDHIYGETEIGGTSWLYLAPVDFEKTELPKLPDDSIPPKAENIQHSLFKWFVSPIALYGLLGLIMASKDKNKEKLEGENDVQS